LCQHVSKWLRCLIFENSTRIVLPAVQILCGRVLLGRCFLVISVHTCFLFLFSPEKRVHRRLNLEMFQRDLLSDCLAYPHTVYAIVLLIDTERTLPIYTYTVWKTDKKILT
jgi:hypothetical protein